MRILAKDMGRETDALVKQMEKHGYTLASVETSGAYDHTAREAIRLLKRDKKRAQWRTVREAIGVIISVVFSCFLWVATLTLIYFLT